MPSDIRISDLRRIGANIAIVHGSAADADLEEVMSKLIAYLRGEMGTASIEGDFGLDVIVEIRQRRAEVAGPTVALEVKDGGGKLYTVGVSESVDVKEKMGGSR